MGNMSYCRFRNTLEDLKDCYENMDTDELDRDEARARLELVRLCQRIASDYEDDLEEWAEGLKAMKRES